MNKFYAVIASFLWMTSGSIIMSNIWNPSLEKIPFAIILFLIGCFYIYRIEELPDEDKLSDKDE